MKRNEIVIAARSCVGAKYRHEGRDYSNGYDCGGVIAHICDVHKYSYEDMNGYSRIPDGRFEALLDKNFDRIPKEEIGIGDIGFYWFNVHGKKGQHTVVYTEYGIIHSTLLYRKVVETPLPDEYKAKLIRGYRFRGLED